MHRPAFALTLLLALPSCNGSKQAQSSAPTGVGPCEQSAPTYCKKVFECSPEDGRQNFGSLERCQIEDAAFCRQYAALPGASAKAMERWAACGSALAARSCEELKYGGLLDACRREAGARELAQPCLDYSQCQSLHCKAVDRPAGMQPELSACGVCAPQARAGESCDGGWGSCGWGTACVGGTCVVQGGEGAACENDHNACLGGFHCVQGACRKSVELGGACESIFDCLYWWAECTDGVCAAPMGIPRGEPCEPEGTPEAPATPCTTSNFCDQTTRRCIPFRLNGESCTREFDCSYLSTCQDGRCAPLTDAICATAKPLEPESTEEGAAAP
jgi:hypothetical protein